MLVLIMLVLPCYLATLEVRRLPRPPATATPRASHTLCLPDDENPTRA